MQNIWGLSAEQLKIRGHHIRGSDAGSIVAGGEEWPRLWEVKTERAKPEDLSGVLRVMMGLATEKLNQYWFELQTGRIVERVQEFQQHPTMSFMGCLLDGVSTTSQGHPAAWQAKHVGKHGEQLEIRYTAQGTHEALCLGVDHYILSTFVGNSRWELGEYAIKPSFAGAYLERCKQFWSYVLADRPPPENIPPLGVPRPRELRKVVLEDRDRQRWPNWGASMADLIADWAYTKPAHDRHMATRAEIVELCPEDVGEISRGLFLLKRYQKSVRLTLGKEKDDE